MSRILAQWMIDRGRPFAAIDADRSHGALLRFYADYTRPVDLSRSDSADEIIDRALAAERSVVVDLPGQSLRSLHTWLTEADVLQFAGEMDIRFTFWHVSDGSYASVSEIGESLRLLGDLVAHVAVKNHGRGHDFGQFEQSEAKRHLDSFEGITIDLPELDPNTMDRIDAVGASFWAAMNAQEGSLALRPLERQRARLWLQKSYAPLDAMADRL